MESRKIIQIAVNPEAANSVFVLFALCDDGTIWGHYRGKWDQVPSIPIDQRSEEAEARDDGARQ